MDGAKPITIAGIEVSPEDRTPLVAQLLRIIAQQQAELEQRRAEIARLKNLPPRPKLRPRRLNEPQPNPSGKKRRRGKRPGSAKRRKTRELVIQKTSIVPLEGLPEGTRQNRYEDYVVQELHIEAQNVCYRRLRYPLPDGTYRTAPLPAEAKGHFGPELCS